MRYSSTLASAYKGRKIIFDFRIISSGLWKLTLKQNTRMPAKVVARRNVAFIINILPITMNIVYLFPRKIQMIVSFVSASKIQLIKSRFKLKCLIIYFDF
jgi:hypothetical protein